MFRITIFMVTSPGISRAIGDFTEEILVRLQQHTHEIHQQPRALPNVKALLPSQCKNEKHQK